MLCCVVFLCIVSCLCCVCAVAVCCVASQGRESSQDEIGSSALLAKSMDDDLNDAAVQVKAMEGGKINCHDRGVAHFLVNTAY